MPFVRSLFILLLASSACGSGSPSLCASATHNPPLPWEKEIDMLFPLFGATPLQYELMFYFHVFDVGGGGVAGPFVFTLGDHDTVNLVIRAALGSSGAVRSVQLRPIGVYTGFSQTSGGIRYVDVYQPATPNDPVPVRRLPGSQALVLGDPCTIGANGGLAPVPGLVKLPLLEADQGPDFLGLVPMAAQLLRVTRIISADVMEVVGLRRHLTDGVQSVRKNPGQGIKATAASFPIAFRPITGLGGYEDGAYWYMAGPPPSTIVFAAGDPVVGPTLIPLLSTLGPLIDTAFGNETYFGGNIDAQLGGLVSGRCDPPLAGEAPNYAVGVYVTFPNIPSFYAPVPTDLGLNLTGINVQGALSSIYHAGPGDEIIVVELNDVVSLPMGWPPIGP